LEKALTAHEKNHKQYLEKLKEDENFISRLIEERDFMNKELEKLQSNNNN